MKPEQLAVMADALRQLGLDEADVQRAVRAVDPAPRMKALKTLWGLARGPDGRSDPEADHKAADAALIGLIDDHAVREAFGRVHKWYG
jgi:hypothetical protein